MKSRYTSVALLLVLLVGLLAVVAASRGKNGAKAQTGEKQQQPKRVAQEVPGTINGEQNPSSIPDRVAYLMLFRTLQERDLPKPNIYARSYVTRAVQGEACETCVVSEENGRDVDAMLSAVERFQVATSPLDNEVKRIKDREWPNPSPAVMNTLTSLQRQKEAIVDQVVAELESHLSAQGRSNLSVFINTHLKTRIKMVPSSSGPPGSPGWNHSATKAHH